MTLDGTRIVAGLGLAWMSAVGSLASADTFTWIDGAGGAFADPGNWSSATVPGVGDVALFTLDGSYTVTFNKTRTFDTALVVDGRVRFAADRSFGEDVPTLQLSGSLRAVDNVLLVGDDEDLATVQDYMHVVSSATSAQDGARIEFRNGSRLDTGTVLLGTVDTASGGSSGSLVVSGWDATDIAFSTLSVGGDVVIGRGNGNGDLRLADRARGFIGGSLLIDDSPSSVNSSGQVTVRQGSSLVFGDLVMGTSGTSQFSSLLSVYDEGSVVTQNESASITLGSKSSTTTMLWVHDGGSFTSGSGTTLLNTSGFLGVGQSGDDVESYYYARGDIHVQTGGLIEVADGGQMHLLVGRTLQTDRADSLRLTGGTLHVNGARIVTPYLQFSGAGRLNFNYGTLAFTQDLVLDSTYAGHLLGTSARIGNLQTLEVAGKATLETPLYLDGGTFSVGSLSNAWLLQFERGTLALTNSGLTISAGQAFGDTLTLDAGQILRVTEETQVYTDGRLVMQGGHFVAGTLGNQGEIQLNGPASRLEIASLKNDGVVRGEGEIASPAFSNNEAGEIRVGGGERLRVRGALTNVGQVDVIGGELDVTGTTVNGREGMSRPPIVGPPVPGGLFARDATLRFGGGLTNLAGTVGFSFGTSDVFGDVTNLTDGTVTVSGGSSVTFYDDVINQGELRVSEGATAVYFGDVSGSGKFTGSGLNLFEGKFSPGSSPAIVVFEGDIAFGELSELIFELGGTIPGEEHDQVQVGGDLHLGGTLRVVYLDDYMPTLGDSFQILQFDPLRLTGEFATQILPDLTSGLSWDTGDLYTTGTIAVVPEPATGGAIAAILLACMPRRKSRRSTRSH